MAEEIVGPGFEKSGFIFQKEREHIIQNVKRILIFQWLINYINILKY